MDKKAIRQLWRLADRMGRNAAVIRNAELPCQLNKTRLRALKHLNELTAIRQAWAERFTPTRRPKHDPNPMLCQCQMPSFWAGRRRH